MSKSDPIRKRYFEAVERADMLSDALFYAGALLSFATLLLDKDSHPLAYKCVMIAFAIAVFALFVMGQFGRLYLTPRAEDKRRKDFFSNVYDVPLIGVEKTDGYYNSGHVSGMRRLAVQLLDNSHFSKAIALRMARFERWKVALYSVLWLVCLLHRETDLGIVVTASQAVFSEQLVSRWLRLEWMRMRFEKTYDEVCRLFHSKPSAQAFDAMTLDSLGFYEAAKATGGVTLSSRLFHRMNEALSREWDETKAQLKL